MRTIRIESVFGYNCNDTSCGIESSISTLAHFEKFSTEVKSSIQLTAEKEIYWKNNTYEILKLKKELDTFSE